jgi:hypothetical protein
MKYAIFCLFSLAVVSTSFAQQNDEMFNLIKKDLADSKQSIKQYEWIETTTTYVKGEQKSLKQNRCYYDVTGKLMKVATGNSQAEGKKRGGIKGRVAENKKDEMQDYIEESIAKIQSYLPPDGAKLQKIYASGKSVLHVLDPGKKFKIDFPDYAQKGDMIAIALDKEKNLLNGVSVNTYLDKPDDKVNFEMKYQSLPDGTQYTGETTLNAEAKKVKIVIQNSGFKKQ